MKAKGLMAVVVVGLFIGTVFAGCIGWNKVGESFVPKLKAVETDIKSSIGGVKYRGLPEYIPQRAGGVISDFGSHFAVECDIDNPKFAAVKYYQTFPRLTTNASTVALQSIFSIEGMQPTSDSREVEFMYWGWNEQMSFGGISAVARIFTIKEDAFLIALEFNSANSQSFVPMIELTASNANYAEAGSALVCSMMDMVTFAELKSPEQYYFAFLPSFGKAEVTSDSAGCVIKCNQVNLVAGETLKMSCIVGCARDSQDLAVEIAEQCSLEYGNDTGKALKFVDDDWSAYFDNLPKPHTSEQKFVDLYYVAAAGLRMSLMAPIDEFEYWGSIADKQQICNLFHWDDIYTSLALSEFDPWLADQAIRCAFDNRKDDGMVYAAVGMSMSNPPNIGWVMKQIKSRFTEGNELSALQDDVYPQLEKWLEWWVANRESDGDGLFEYAAGIESGWDDSPRFDMFLTGLNPGMIFSFVSEWPLTLSDIFTVDCVDLNCWILDCYRVISQWYEEKGNGEKAEEYKGKIEALSALIDSQFWDEDMGAWYDRYSINAIPYHTFQKVNTPAMAWPLEFGATSNISRVKRVIEEHILNPDEFFGQYPMPSVAYNDPTYYTKGPIQGYYWRGNLWTHIAYNCVETVYKYGYEDESKELVRRLSDTSYDAGGPYEIIDTRTGEGATSDAAVSFVNMHGGYLYNWDCAVTIEMLLDRHQRERFILPDETEFSGYVKDGISFESRETFYTIDTGEYEIPHVAVQSLDGKPILESGLIRIMLSDDYDSVGNDAVEVTMGGTTFNVKIGHSYELSVNGDNATINETN